ncbi:right-handed parallel beta-helix repeat-containing protein [Thermophagus sp. OGC60D27]|uniref:right-handed parallel beta-helix repeat-containing protein n=1 Tax=Thermophagus sp. OGC60D27 TaxID=3458415 RepID=UPI004037F2B6
MKTQLFLLLVILTINLTAQHHADYYVAVDGDDSNPGTFEEPWGTWQKAFATAQAGDTVYFRGGVWYPQEHSRGNVVCEIHVPDGIGHSGTESNPICFFAYPGETPILDCSQVDMTGNNFNGGLDFYGTSNIHIKGLTIRNVEQPASGELASGVGASMCSNMTFENLTVYNIGGRGMSYWGVAGHPEVPEIPADTTRFINCDIYNCVDLLSEVPGNGSDAVKMDAEKDTYLYFYGCRAWACGDDGFDVSGPGVAVFDHCWSFNHSLPGALDGNGFKFGANRGANASVDENGQLILGTPVPGIRKIVKNCIAANNAGYGFYELGYAPYYPNNARVYNNVSFRNGIGMSNSINAEYSGQNPSVYRNNIIYEPVQSDAAGRPLFLVVDDIYIESHNNWDYANSTVIGSLFWWQPTDSVVVAADDFISLDASQLSKPRKDDGSLPDITFMKLAPGSDLIDAGTDVGTPYNGTAPDIGYAEFDPMTIIETTKKEDSSLLHCYPNPTRDIIKVCFNSDLRLPVNIKLFNSKGEIVFSKTVQSDLLYDYPIHLKTFSTGIYFLVLNYGDQTSSAKILKI